MNNSKLNNGFLNFNFFVFCNNQPITIENLKNSCEKYFIKLLRKNSKSINQKRLKVFTSLKTREIR